MPDETGTDLRRRILDATRHLLVTEGYASLSMRRIARAIGYSATSIYLYFDSKDALFHALIDEGMEELHRQLRAAAEHHPEEPLERLVALCRAYVSFGLSFREYYEVMFMLHPERMARFPAESYRRARRSLELIGETLNELGDGAAARAGKGAGQLAPALPLVEATALWTSLHGLVALLIAERIDVRVGRELLVATALRRVLRGYAPDELRHEWPDFV